MMSKEYWHIRECKADVSLSEQFLVFKKMLSLVSLFNGKSTFVGYLMPKQS